MQYESELRNALKKYWGFDDFLPLQLDAMNAVMNNRDSLCVFPTGGGKSLCFQAPAVCQEGLGVVVSPLISLMKDQVDSLQACGISSAFFNSSLSGEERSNVTEKILGGGLQLLYLAPEMLLTKRMLELLKSTRLSFFAIDEAHCVSEWGHDFRPEYRQLRVLKSEFPNVGIHAYTATAKPEVRKDIANQLSLSDPKILVSSVDRPNLTYQIRRRQGGIEQIVEVLEKNRGSFCDTLSNSDTFVTMQRHLIINPLTRTLGY